MASVNKVIILGNLGKDPQMNRFDGGKVKASFSVATSEKYGTGEDKKTVTQWHNIVLWGKLAEIAEKYLGKGNPVYIEGKVTYRDYEDKDGNKKFITEIVGDHLQLISTGTPKEQKIEASINAQAPATPEDDLSF